MPAENAAMLARLLDGEPGPRREAVLLNAARGARRRGAGGQPRRRATRSRAASIDERRGGAVVFRGLKEASRAA